MSCSVPYEDLNCGRQSVTQLRAFVKTHKLFKGYSKMKRADLISNIQKASDGTLPMDLRYKKDKTVKKPLIKLNGDFDYLLNLLKGEDIDLDEKKDDAP